MQTPPTLSRLEILRIELETYRHEHRDLDEAILALHDTPRADILSIQRLKKRKLVLKDRIARLTDAINPDLIA
ncbi:MAG: DUF465 domain-containing protein [Rhodobacteraceae bacterium]|nr:DUF465 domain-containing protein [Paracoccaceae bacterium]